MKFTKNYLQELIQKTIKSTLQEMKSLPHTHDWDTVYHFYRDLVSKQKPELDTMTVDILAARQVIEHADEIAAKAAKSIKNNLVYQASQVIRAN